MGVSRFEVARALELASGRAVGLPPDVFAAEQIAGEVNFLAAVDAEGEWAVVIISQTTDAHVPAVRLATLSADFGVRCRLDSRGVATSARVSIVRCRTDDFEVRRLFSTFVAALIFELSPAPTERSVAEEVSRWAALFWRLQSAARTDVTGLIGELVVLDSGLDTAAWEAAWHSSPMDAIDFGFTNPRMEIEVKATTGRERMHTLALHQAVVSDSRRYFASVMVEFRDSGQTVGELANAISDRLTNDRDRMNFWGKLADVCGQQIGEFLATRFVRETSSETLEFYRVDDVPAPIVEMPLPAGVSNLRFLSDFSSVLPVPAGPICRFPM